ncbi:hypothetical protein SLEP1_g22764 [Rubroshorea leprosula]|uniref:Integrase zinc-binding domain-containing protein n=1 Tax=Rubroshorea leprosula TaxID=152421 RepID=A0AAV5JA71_9ROSI|nr:hypothetical protein SLEP1_g22764 [Rubroshorea leprosula]
MDSLVDCAILSIDPSMSSWATSLIEYLEFGTLLEDESEAWLVRHRVARFCLQAASISLLKCSTPYEAEYAIREVHEEVCGTHIRGRTLAPKLLRQGYCKPQMIEDTQNYVKKCPTCQFNANDIHMLASLVPTMDWKLAIIGNSPNHTKLRFLGMLECNRQKHRLHNDFSVFNGISSLWLASKGIVPRVKFVSTPSPPSLFWRNWATSPIPSFASANALLRQTGNIHPSMPTKPLPP